MDADAEADVAGAESPVADESAPSPQERDLTALITRIGIAAWSLVGAAVLLLSLIHISEPTRLQ